MRRTLESLAILFLLLAAFAPIALTQEADGPGGFSRYFHIECGKNVSGNPPWGPAHDQVSAVDGYRYKVEGNSYNGGGIDNYCWFFTTTGRVTIDLPKGTVGTLYLRCLDLSSNSRVQAITVEDSEPVTVKDFFPPQGRWVRTPIEAEDTADGQIAIDIRRIEGTNAVISRVDFIPDGVANPIITQAELDELFKANMIQDDWATQERQKGRQIGTSGALTALLTRGRAFLDDMERDGDTTFVKESRRSTVKH